MSGYSYSRPLKILLLLACQDIVTLGWEIISVPADLWTLYLYDLLNQRFGQLFYQAFDLSHSEQVRNTECDQLLIEDIGLYGNSIFCNITHDATFKV